MNELDFIEKNQPININQIEYMHRYIIDSIPAIYGLSKKLPKIKSVLTDYISAAEVLTLELRKIIEEEDND